MIQEGDGIPDKGENPVKEINVEDVTGNTPDELNN